MVYEDNFIDEIKSQWKENRLMLFLEATGIICGIIAAITLATLQSIAPFGFSFSLYLVSSLLLLYAAYYQRNSRLALLNIVYTLINIVGVINGFQIL